MARESTQIAVLGGGRMGAALVAGLLAAGGDPDDVRVAESDPDRRRAIEGELPGVRIVPSAAWAVADADVVVVAVKPGDVGPLLESCADALGPEALVLSIESEGILVGCDPVARMQCSNCSSVSPDGPAIVIERAPVTVARP